MHNILQFSPQLTALEFFSGIGLARAGMAKAGIKTIWANDIDHTKCAMYGQSVIGLFDGEVHDAQSRPTCNICRMREHCRFRAAHTTCYSHSE